MINIFKLKTLKNTLGEKRPLLYRAAYAWCHDATLAEDLVQETLLKAIKNLGQLQDHASLDGWLFGILANNLRDHYRRRRPQADYDELLELPSAAPLPEELHAESQLVARVRLAVASLPLGQRQVLTLVDLGELSYTQAAEALAIPVGTVMSRLCRARQTLRERLQELPATVHELKPATAVQPNRRGSE